MAHIGVRNRTSSVQTLTFDGRGIDFEPNEVKILSDIPHEHITTRVHVQHKKRHKVIDGEKVEEVLPQLQGQVLFEIIPLEEALKHAKPEEDPKVVAARRKAGETAKEKAALFAEFKESLLAEGWQPPVADEAPKAEAPAKKGKGAKKAAQESE